MLRLIIFFSFMVGSAGASERLVSAVPALTEMVYRLEAGDQLVGVSDYCKFPQSTSALKKIGSPFTPHIETIIKLRPTLVLTQKLQDRSFVKKLKQLKISVVEFKIDSYEDVIAAIKKLGKVLKKSSQKIVSDILSAQKALEGLKKSGRFLVIINSEMMSKSAASFMGAGRGTYLSDVIQKSGLRNWFSKVKGYKEIGREKLFVDPPEYIFVFNKKIKENLESSKSKVILLNPDWALIPGPRVSEMMKELVLKLH